MRGLKTFRTITDATRPATTARKGRNDTLLTRRNECLVARYYYYGCDKLRCYEDIMRVLTGEFFLSATTIASIIQSHTELLMELKEKHRSPYFFQSRWPHMKW